MVTLPTEAADDPGLVADLADRGADVMRINCAHDGPREWTRMVANIRAAEARPGAACRSSWTSPGPRCGWRGC